MSEKKKVTVRFSAKLKAEMQTALIESGYGLHGKSKWLQEGIIEFLGQPSFIESVENGISMNQADLTEVEAFYFSPEIIQLLKSAYIKVRTKYPLFEGVQSAIIRSAVVHKLMLK